MFVVVPIPLDYRLSNTYNATTALGGGFVSSSSDHEEEGSSHGIFGI